MRNGGLDCHAISLLFFVDGMHVVHLYSVLSVEQHKSEDEKQKKHSDESDSDEENAMRPPAFHDIDEKKEEEKKEEEEQNTQGTLTEQKQNTMRTFGGMSDMSALDAEMSAEQSGSDDEEENEITMIQEEQAIVRKYKVCTLFARVCTYVCMW